MDGNDEMYIPGTIIQVPYNMIENISTVLSPILDTVEGLMLSQVVAISDNLSNETIQNWVKRGLVPNAVNRKYYSDQVARILILNILRDSLQLERIIELIQSVNTIDTYISEKDLYVILCKVILNIEHEKDLNYSVSEDIIKKQISTLSGIGSQSREKLFDVLEIMVLGYISTFLKRKMDKLFKEKFNAGGSE